MQSCPNCSAAIPSRFRVCGMCGELLRPDLAREIRRDVTVFFSDLKGSTTLGESLDSEALFEVLARYFDAMRLPLERNGGTIEKLIGDAILAVFGLPRAHPDDPLRAVRAAAECQAALADLDEDLERTYGVRLTNRTGLASGQVVIGLPGPGEHVLTGEVLREAMELEAAAPPMGVLLAESTHRAVGRAVFVEPVPLPPSLQPAEDDGADDGELGACAYELLRLAPDAPPLAVEPDMSGTGTVFCTNCGEENPGEFRLCGLCGGLLRDDERAQESRKTVTVLFCDLRPTDVEGAALPAAVVRDIISRGFAAARSVVEQHGGSVEKFVGDALVCVFGLPVLHEDDALRAVRSAERLVAVLADLDRELAAEAVRLTVRIGVNTGLVVAGHATRGLHLVTGDAVNTAARLEQAAPAGGILLGDATYGLVRDAVEVEPVEPLRLKGKAEPVIAHRLVAVRGVEGRARRHSAPLVGREAELAALLAAYHRSVVQNGPRLVTLLGDAGIGKSRLVREFERRVGAEATLLRGRCPAYGEGITFAPIIEMLRGAADIRDDDTPAAAHARIVELVGERDVADRLAAIAGLTDMPFPLVELYWGVRRLFEILAARRPLVAVVDGVQWAEPALADLLEQLLAVLAERPVLLVCLARHELLEERPDWGPGARSSRIVLPPLEPEAGRHALAGLLDRAVAASDLGERIVVASQGNPLFLEQMVSMLVDSGALRVEDGHWIRAAAMSEIALPPTIQALLAARLDRLPREERGVVQPAAVVGYEFGRPAVEVLVEEPLRPTVPERLGSLVSRQFVRPDPDAPPEEDGYRFRNQLIRDAAYQGLLKRARVSLHERYVAWMDGLARERGREREFEELLGFHLEQAYRYRTEFGPPDAEATAIGRDGARRLASAGRRASVRGEMVGAANLLGRATALLPERDPDRLGLLPELSEALTELGEFDRAEAVLDEAATLAAAVGDDRLATNAALVRTLLGFYQGVEGWRGKATSTAEAAIATFARLDDPAGLTRAWRILFGVNGAACRYEEAARAAEKVLQNARLAGDPRQEARGASAYAQAALLGPTPVPAALARCTELLDRVQGDRRTEALVLLAIAELEALAGDFERAREHHRRARGELTELGQGVLAASTAQTSWRIEALAGDLEAAERELRRDCEALEAMGERGVLSTLAALLGHVLLDEGRLDEAAVEAARARDLTDADDIGTQATWRSLEAKVLARRGELADAAAVARSAVAILDPTDFTMLRADVRADLADVLERAGDAGAAAGARAEALALYEEKGSPVSAERIRARLVATASDTTVGAETAAAATLGVATAE
ncbi:MAG TPA: adenylate/guanylate cyclase domain-containing protein [Candidatus Limnocylindrales bacterium]